MQVLLALSDTAIICLLTKYRRQLFIKLGEKEIQIECTLRLNKMITTAKK